MVVCKCRKATKLYCFVHKVPLCGECICFPEHQICVVHTYSEWVIDGEYDWPTRCCLCSTSLEGESDSMTVRLSCLHLIHTNCLVSHIKSYPLDTSPANYVCPTCSQPIWSPKSIKDSESLLHTKLKETIIQNGFGNQLHVESRPPPPAFSSDPLLHVGTLEGQYDANSALSKDSSLSSMKERYSNMNLSTSDIVEIEPSTSLGSHFNSEAEPNIKKSSTPVPGATTRKGAHLMDRQNSEIPYDADDEDGTHRKYIRRGPLRHKFLRFLLPFWSSALPTLPVTAPPRSGLGDDVSESRLRQQRSSKLDPRKILLTIAIMACLATMGVLYYRLAQRSLTGSQGDNGR